MESVIRLESDRFQYLDYDEAAFQTEAGAVHGEYLKNRSNPWEVLNERLRETAFTTHTYGHTTIGFERDIVAMPTLYEYSMEFFSRYYRPENTILLLVGDFDVREASTLIRKYYGDWEAGYVAPEVLPEAPQRQERRVSIKYDGRTLPLLVVSWKGLPLNPSDGSMVAGSMLGELLFGEASPLYKKLVIKEQKVQYIGATFGFNRDPGLWSVYATIKDKKDVPYILREIDRTVARAIAAEPSAQDVERLKKRLRYSFLMSLDNPDRVAANLARFVALTGGVDVIDELFTAYETTTAAQLRQAAASLLKRQTRTIAVLTGR
jgi:zinc protease